MFSGIQEILLIAIIIGAILLIPRMTASRHRPSPRVLPQRKALSISRTARLAVVISFFWLSAWALVLKPWQFDPTRFFALGVGPVAIGWALKWILAGKKKKR